MWANVVMEDLVARQNRRVRLLETAKHFLAVTNFTVDRNPCEKSVDISLSRIGKVMLEVCNLFYNEPVGHCVVSCGLLSLTRSRR